MKKRYAASLGIAGALLLLCAVDVVRSKANGILDGISFSGAYADRRTSAFASINPLRNFRKNLSNLFYFGKTGAFTYITASIPHPSFGRAGKPT